MNKLVAYCAHTRVGLAWGKWLHPVGQDQCHQVRIQVTSQTDIVFYEELIKIFKEQDKFQESIEMKVALAEATDPVQDIFFECAIGLLASLCVWTLPGAMPFACAQMHASGIPTHTSLGTISKKASPGPR